jgi:hypothetical protein
LRERRPAGARRDAEETMIEALPSEAAWPELEALYALPVARNSAYGCGPNARAGGRPMARALIGELVRAATRARVRTREGTRTHPWARRTSVDTSTGAFESSLPKRTVRTVVVRVRCSDRQGSPRMCARAPTCAHVHQRQGSRCPPRAMARAHVACARRRTVRSTEIKALPAWLGDCTKLQILCAPRQLRTSHCDGCEQLAAAATHSIVVPAAARSEQSLRLMRILRTLLTRSHRPPRRGSGAGMCARTPTGRRAQGCGGDHD